MSAEPAGVLTQLHPLDYLRIAYRRRWLIVATVTLGVAAAAVYNAVSVPIFESQATILIESDKPNVITIPDVLNEGTAQDGYFQTQLQLLSSRALALRTAAALPAAARTQLGGDAEAVADAIRDRLRIVQVRGSRLVNVRVRSSDAQLAATIANTHARAYIEQSLDYRFRASKEASEWLDSQLAAERTHVEEVESALQAYREQHDALSLTSGQDIVVQKLADLNAAVTRAKVARIEKEAQYRQLLAAQRDRTALDAAPAILSNPFIQQLKGDLSRLQREHSEMAESLGERHPTLIAKRTELETVEARLNAEIAKVVESARSAYEGARTEEASMTSALGQQKQEALALNRRGIEYAALEREAQSVRQVYQTLLQRARETGVTGELRTTNVRIIDPARVPDTPTMRRVYNLVVAAGVSLLLAVLLVLGLEYLDDRARTPDDVRRGVMVPVIGMFPELRRVNGAGPSMLQADAPSVLVEGVRALRTSLLATVPPGSRRSVVIASGSEGEGKSLVASSLAIALAQAHHRVLLIDADMRRPTMHSLFGQRLEPGLSGVLSGEATLADILMPTAIPGLTVTSAGGPTQDAPELLGSPRAAELFDVLESHFSWVIIDSPPSLSVTDASIVARRSTGVLFVVASGRTSIRTARLAVDELRSAGAQILGAVLTRADLDQHPFYFSPYGRVGYHGHPLASRATPPSPATTGPTT